MEPLETSELLAFTKTIEAKSLSRAASELGVPRATVGRRLARLEERLGVRLLRRTTRSLTLTDAGDAFYRHARIVLDAVTQAEESVRKDDQTIRGSLRVSVPPMTDGSFHELVCEFGRAHPNVQLHINATARYVDLLRDGYDLAMRASLDLEPGLVSRTLVRARVIAVASPSYLAASGTPQRVRDLRSHNCLLGFARGEVPHTHWPRLGGGRVAVEGSFVANDVKLLAEAARRGLGIALLPTLLIAPLVERGELVQVLPELIGAESRVSLVYPEKEFMPPQVRAFIDAVVAWSKEGLSSLRLAERCGEASKRRGRPVRS
ncbi:MAG: LysR family transcriptional regulator [Polyangiaceae bacterium]